MQNPDSCVCLLAGWLSEELKLCLSTHALCDLQVRVEAGCRVQQVADALKPYGLSLQNYASIREQQIGGFTQVSGGLL